jgi:hypothetical protein
MSSVFHRGGAKSSATQQDVDRADRLGALKGVLPDLQSVLEVESMNDLSASIYAIKDSTDFNKWLISFMDEVKRSPDVFSQNDELSDFLRNVSRFAASDHRGYFSSLGGQSPAENPASWQLLAHVLYSNFPSKA